MKSVKKGFKVLVFLVVLFVVFIFCYLQYSKPNYEGEILLKNIEKATTVYFDDFGIPHIYSNSQKDAMLALGYVHAQDRLWQMELMRRIAPGKLSEIFGSVMLKNDKFFAGLGIDEASEKAISELDKNSETYKLTMAYLDGVNHYIEEGKTPIEFTLLGIEKQKLTIKDVYNIFGYMSFSFAMAQKTDPLLTNIRDKFGAEYLKDFALNGSLGTKQLKSFKGNYSDYSEISKSVASILDNSPIPPFIGSNSWVIGGEKTKSGKVLFENDPHIGFSQPGTWYEAHIITPNYEMYGYHLAGTPFPLLGHNRNYAYGLTMFENDDLDFFQEEENPNNSNQYKTITGFENYKTITKIIKVKDSTSIKLKVKITKNGPIMNGLVDGLTNEKPISMFWIYTQEKNQLLQAVYSLSHATNFHNFKKGIELIHAPGLNIMYGDAQNNIAWTTSGKLYKVPKSVNTNFILSGTNDIDDKKEFLPFLYNPQALNPIWNYVYSSNNQTEAVNNYLYPGYYLPKDRATRIDTLLQSKNNWTRHDVEKMALDNTSSTAQETVLKWVLTLNKNASGNEKQATTILKNWKATNNVNDIAPTIFNKWVYFYLKNTFQDELGEKDFNSFLGTHIMKQLISTQSQNENSVWWDNLKTKNHKETREEILNTSFKEAISSLENQLGKEINSWTWNKVHSLEIGHPIGKVKALRGFFNVGPYEVAGANEVINNMIFTYSDNKINEVKAGPSTRRIVDFSDVENSVSILPSGQSGNPMSKHYNDQTELFVQGKFRKMKMNKVEIIKSSSKLVFLPRN
ncbi:penicillin acylase family protein [Flavobacterium sp.]|uniref:penicillin acylase family protein n=1 Tax=Flavobacterium sp. TaxID=239 RepID=UPI003753E14D